MQVQGRDKTHSISFLKKRGFEEKTRDWESHLRVREFDFNKFPGYLEKMGEQGITITTLREMLQRDPQCYRKLYELVTAVPADMPL